MPYRGTAKFGAPLSRREVDVMNELAKGHSARQTAHNLGIRVKSVDKYRERIRQKLGLVGTGCRGTSKIVQYAMRYNRESK